MRHYQFARHLAEEEAQTTQKKPQAQPKPAVKPDPKLSSKQLDVKPTEVLSRDTVASELKKLGYENLKINGNIIHVLVQIPDGAKKNDYRIAVIREIASKFAQVAPEHKPQYIQAKRLGSLGGIIFQDSPAAIVVKDEGKQGEESAGVANEIELAGILQSVIEKFGSANVTFKDPRGKKMTIKNATQVDVAGRETKGRKKADVVLVSAKGRLPISIKQLDADMWESADRLFGARAKEIIANLQKKKAIKIAKSLDDEGNPIYRLEKEIVVEPTEEEALNAIFGADLNPAGGVVIQTFKPEHFTQKDNNVEVECHAVIKNWEDIPESHLMVWLIRNDKTRSNPLPGLRTLGVTLTRGIGKKGTKDVILVDKNGNVVKNPNI